MSDKLPHTTLRSNSRLVRRVVTWGSVAMLLMGAALLYMLTLATNNQALYEQDYALLFVLNMVVAALLLAAKKRTRRLNPLRFRLFRAACRKPSNRLLRTCPAIRSFRGVSLSQPKSKCLSLRTAIVTTPQR